MNGLTTIEVDVFLTSISIVEILKQQTAHIIVIVTDKGIDPEFFQRYTMLLNTQPIEYIKQQCQYTLENIQSVYQQQYLYIAVTFERALKEVAYDEYK